MKIILKNNKNAKTNNKFMIFYIIINFTVEKVKNINISYFE